MQTLQLTKNYEKYPEYKDSGVAWIGKIPKEWESQKIVSVFDFPNDKVTEENYEPLSVTYDGIKKQVENAAKVAEGSLRKHVKIGDIAINGRSDRKGAVGMSEYEGGVSLVYNVLRKRNQDFDSKYFHYLFRSILFSEEFYRWGRGIVDDLWTTRESEMKRIFITVPKPEQQTRIASYLDKKTALIDQIIEKKEKLIELLREKRTAVINQVVTRGLDPKAELVDSDIDWIGKIPKDWKMSKLKYVAEIIPSNIDKLTVEGESVVRLCNYVDVYKNEKITKQMFENLMIASASKKQIEKLSLLSGDVIITKDSETPDDIGVPAYVPENLPGVVCGYHLAIIRHNKIEGGYMFRFFQSQSAKIQFFLSANGLTRYGLGIGDIGGAILPVPPKDEQVKIAIYLDEKNGNCSKAIDCVEQSIEKLQEFKSSLISNAVTGKIKI